MRAIAGFIFVALVAATIVMTQPTEAKALSGSEFQPGNIINNENFFDYNSMTVEQIQAFLDAKGPATCNGCLREYVASTYDRPADPIRCVEPLVGKVDITAAQMIYDVAQACHVNPQVMLVTLQKEQSLVTLSSPSATRYQKAMGYGCPDTAPCDTAYYGLFIQLYSASAQLVRYGAPGSPYTWYPVGATTAIKFHPSSTSSPTSPCGYKAVYIENRATAALYYYTPYTPNDAALANLFGTGDSCSSYGNRNFWRFYNDWFGDPLAFVPEGVTVSRIGGEDRYATSVAISQANFPAGAPVVYIATGANFPDALSAAPVAAKATAPLLLSPANAIPDVVRAEIVRLAPGAIVVVGGTGSISDEVVADLGTLAPIVTRLSGDDRYGTSRALATDAFGVSGAPLVFLATGATFPDALSASAAAGFKEAPVILIRGGDSALDANTIALMSTLGTTDVVIAGGIGSISVEIETELQALPGMLTVKRLGGDDRFATSGNMNRDAFTSTTTVYIASGMSFPDALSGAAVAGQQDAPLYVIPTRCIPSYVVRDIVSMGATQMVILGGTGVVGTDVEGFNRCR